MTSSIQNRITNRPTGVWLLGDEGTEKTSLLASQLYEQIKKREEIALSRIYREYTPWMCMDEARSELSEIYAKSLSDVLVDHDSLAILAKAFSDGSEIPLGRLRFDGMHADQCIYQGKDSDEAGFVEMMRQGRDLYLDAHPRFRARWNGIVKTLVPIEVGGILSDNRAAFSSHLLKGAVFRAIPRTSDPFWKLDLAIDLAHELGHQTLILYQSADPIIVSDLSEKVFSGIRQTDRPSIMSFHAAAALAYMIEYMEIQLSDPQALSRLSSAEIDYGQSELTNFYRQLSDTLSSASNLEFSELGEQIYREYLSLVE